MIALVITLIITIATVAHFYLKFTPMKSFVSLMASIIGFTVAFSYYEVLADLLISRGYIPLQAQCLCFLLVFVISGLIIEVLSDYVVGANIDFGQFTKTATAVVCGIVTGLIISGVIVIALGLAPFRKSIPYARFGDTINVSAPSSSMIPADGFVTDFYNLISKGALGTGNSFEAAHPDFINQIHLNRYAAKEGIAIVAAKDAAFVEKFGVRRKELPGGDVRTVVELNLRTKSIKDGGAMDSNNTLSLTLSQTALICAPDGQSELTGNNVKVLYPVKYLIKGMPVKNDVQLSEVISFDRDSYVQTSKGKAARIGLAFMVPENLTPRLLQFKANNLIKLPKLATKEDIEAAAKEDDSTPQ